MACKVHGWYSESGGRHGWMRSGVHETQLSCTHEGRVMLMWFSKLSIIDSDNAIVRTNAGMFIIGHVETNLGEIIMDIHTFLFKKMQLKVSSGNWRAFCIGPNLKKKQTRTRIVLYESFFYNAKMKSKTMHKLLQSRSCDSPHMTNSTRMQIQQRNGLRSSYGMF